MGSSHSESSSEAFRRHEYPLMDLSDCNTLTVRVMRAIVQRDS